MPVSSHEYERLQEEARSRDEVYVEATPIGEKLGGAVRGIFRRGSGLEGLSTEELEEHLVSAHSMQRVLDSRRYRDYHRGIGTEIREMREESAAARRSRRLERALRRKQEQSKTA